MRKHQWDNLFHTKTHKQEASVISQLGQLNPKLLHIKVDQHVTQPAFCISTSASANKLPVSEKKVDRYKICLRKGNQDFMKNFHKMVDPPSCICEILIQIFWGLGYTLVLGLFSPLQRMCMWAKAKKQTTYKQEKIKIISAVLPLKAMLCVKVCPSEQ